MVDALPWLRAALIGILAVLGTVSSRAASITGFAPDRGPAGTEVTIAGTGLATATFVYFGATDAAGEILSRTATSVRARVPANALSGQISIFTSGSGAATSAGFFVAAPRIESYDPVTGSPGTLVTINGANLGTGLPGGRGAVTNVLFNGVRAQFQVVALNQLLALVPTNAASGPITVGNEAGTVTTFTSFEIPALIAGFTPAAALPGDSIEVRGRNFTSTVRVELGLVSAPFSVISPTNLVLWIPTNAVNGRLQITTQAGTTTTSSNLVVLPRIIRFTPATGQAGTNVVLEGGGLNGVTGVQFNNLPASYLPVSSTRVETLVPAAAESGPIRITTTNGTFVTTADFGLPARISVVSPGTGRRGDVITVDGQNFRGTTRVTLNGVDAPFTLISSTRLTFTIPAAATSGKAALTTPSGEVTSSGSVVVRAVFDGFTPANGPIGSAFNLLGAGLTNLAWIRLGGIDATFTVLSSTSVRALVPVGAYSGTVRLRAGDGTELESVANFFVDGVHPAVTSFAPDTGLAGTKVTLQGSGLRTASKVQFNGVDAAFTVKSPTQIEATVPGAATTGTIAVTTLDGIAITSASFVVRNVEVALAAEIGPGTLTLRWPTEATGFTLESSPRVGPEASWQTVGQAPIVDGATWRVTVVLPQTGNRYFRLRR